MWSSHLAFVHLHDVGRNFTRSWNANANIRCESTLRHVNVAVLMRWPFKRATSCGRLCNCEIRETKSSSLFRIVCSSVMLLQRTIKLTGERRQRKIDRCLSRVNASDIEASKFEFFFPLFYSVRRKGAFTSTESKFTIGRFFWKFEVLFILMDGNDRKLFQFISLQWHKKWMKV